MLTRLSPETNPSVKQREHWSEYSIYLGARGVKVQLLVACSAHKKNVSARAYLVANRDHREYSQRREHRTHAFAEPVPTDERASFPRAGGLTGRDGRGGGTRTLYWPISGRMVWPSLVRIVFKPGARNIGWSSDAYNYNGASGVFRWVRRWWTIRGRPTLRFEVHFLLLAERSKVASARFYVVSARQRSPCTGLDLGCAAPSR